MNHRRTIDPVAVEYYTRLADTWWDEQGPFWPLHTLNRLRVGWIQAQLKQQGLCSPQGDLRGLKVLDIGCGGGILAEALARLGADVTGIDVVEKNLTVARHHARAQNLDIHYQLIAADALARTGQQFDIVFNMEVVEHVADLALFMSASNLLVKPGGVQFLATINRNLLAGLVAIIGAEYLLHWLPKGTHQYRKLVTPGELRALLTADRFTELAGTGVNVNPFSKSMGLTSKMWVNYMLLARKARQ